METVALCESDPFCRRVLAKHWPDVPIHVDIRDLNGEQYRGTVDVVCGGFPCQPFSVAGDRRGAADDRALWPEMLRVIRESRPAWVIGENVAGFISMGLRQCLLDLESLGYGARVFVIPACAVGAPHRRDRVWIIGNANGQGESTGALNAAASGVVGEVAANADGSGLREQPGRSSGQDGAEKVLAELNGAEGLASDSNNAGRQQQRRPLADGSEYKAAECGIGRPTEPPLCGTDDGIPNRVDRLRALGNAVVPQIPEIIGRAIMAAEGGAGGP